MLLLRNSTDPMTDFVQWSREQMENYCVMYKKQLDSTDDSRIIGDCYDITKAQNKRVRVPFFWSGSLLTSHTAAS